MGFSCFVSTKGCELPLIPPTGRWIPAVEVVPGGGGWSRRVLGEEDADALSVLYMRLDGGSGSLAFAALHVMVFFVGLGWARRRAAGGERELRRVVARMEDEAGRRVFLQTSPSGTLL